MTKRQKILKAACEWFWILFAGSVAGFVLEGIWCIITKGHWENHSALIYGPFCVIYGIGMLLAYIAAKHLENKSILIQGAIFLAAGTLVEYLMSLAQEKFFGSVSWDYSDKFMNIGGRVCLRMSLIWGAMGVVFAKWIYPVVKRFLVQIERPSAKVITAVVFVFMVINVVISAVAVGRWHLRSAGCAPKNRVESWVDEHYDDSRMKKVYSNMYFVD